MQQVTITVFTPTYNRAYILPKLFNSLQNQTYTDFEWLLIDDGSTDDTESIVIEFRKEAKFPINYIKKENQGKHIAMNLGFELAKGELFFIVDSDDSITENALEFIINRYEVIKNDNEISGIGFPYYSTNKEILVENFVKEEWVTTLLSYDNNMYGDMCYVFKTHVLKEYPFPVFEDENFCPESLIWKRMALKYKILFNRQCIYLSEYQNDGLSSQYYQLLLKNLKYAILNYGEMANYNIPFSYKLGAVKAYWDFALRDKSTSFYQKFIKVPIILSIRVLMEIYFKKVKNRAKRIF